MKIFFCLLEFLSWIWLRSQGLLTLFCPIYIITFCIQSFIYDFTRINLLKRYFDVNLQLTNLLTIWLIYFIFASLFIRIAEKSGQPLYTLIKNTIRKWLSY